MRKSVTPGEAIATSRKGGAMEASTAPPPLIPIQPIAVINSALANLHLASEAPEELGLVVRKSRVDSAYRENLKASIKAVGILVPMLTHRHKGRTYVTAGNQRLEILRELFAGSEGEIFVPIVDDETIQGTSRELAVMHNIAWPMHPIDQYEVVASAHDAGMSLADIGARWGLTDRRVRQVMAYGGLHPKVRQAWRDGVIDAKTAQAYTLAPAADQDKLFEKLRKQGGRYDHRQVRDALTGKQHDAGRLLEFVGVDAYEAGGGTATVDLFERSHTVSDVKLLTRLAQAKLDEACKQLVELGWKWAEHKPTQNEWEFGRTNPKKLQPSVEHKAQLDALKTATDDDGGPGPVWQRKSRIDSEIVLASYYPEERARLGCFVSIDQQGRLAVDPGRVRPEEKKKEAARERGAERTKKKTTAAAKGESSLMISNALAQRLSEQLTHAASEAILASPDVALAALIAGFASHGDVVDVVEHGLVTKQSAGGFKVAAFESVFTEAIDSDNTNRLVLRLVQIAAAALDFQVHRADQKPLDNKGVRALCEALSPGKLNDALKKHFDAKDYFNGVSREVCVSAIKEMLPSGAADASKGHKTKADAAAAAVDLAKVKGWLPLQLRTIHYTGPGAGKSAPDKPKGKRGVARKGQGKGKSKR